MHSPTVSTMNFDEILSVIGGFGKFQKILYVWICLPQIFLAFHMLVSVFTGAVPPHSCRFPRLSAGTPASSNFSLLTTRDGQPDLSCTIPLNHSSAESLGNGHPTVSCPEGWKYSTETFQNTIVTEVSGNPAASWINPDVFSMQIQNVERLNTFITMASGDIWDRAEWGYSWGLDSCSAGPSRHPYILG